MDAISCLAPLPATSFTDAALAHALRFSMSDHSASSSSSTNHHHSYSPLLYADNHHLAPYVVTSSAPVAAADDYSPRRSSSTTTGGGGGGSRLAPAGARAGKKRRSRASKRAPTTYISTDPTNFRLMVQQITGVQAEPAVSLAATDSTASMLLLPAHDTNQLPTTADQHHHHQQQPCFPTLDSWNVVNMYQSNHLL